MYQTKVPTCKLSEATKHFKEGFLLVERVQQVLLRGLLGNTQQNMPQQNMPQQNLLSSSSHKQKHMFQKCKQNPLSQSETPLAKPGKPPQPIGNPLSNVFLFETIYMCCVIIGTIPLPSGFVVSDSPRATTLGHSLRQQNPLASGLLIKPQMGLLV